MKTTNFWRSKHSTRQLDKTTKKIRRYIFSQVPKANRYDQWRIINGAHGAFAPGPPAKKIKNANRPTALPTKPIISLPFKLFLVIIPFIVLARYIYTLLCLF